MRRREVAREIRSAARSWAENADDDEEDRSMAKLYRADAKDLMRVAQLVDAGRIQQARDACNMDTIVRDQLPNSFFDLLEKHDVQW